MALFTKPVAIICLHGSHTVPCKKYHWCMHIVWIQCIPCFCRSLVTPSCSCAQITKSCSRVISIHLCCCYNVLRWGRKATTPSQSRFRKRKKNPFSPFQAIFPGFISKSSRVENSILKEKWRGGGESWMKKEGGLRGYNPTTSKKASLSPFPSLFTFIISTIGDLVQNQSRSWWRCGRFGRWWTKRW